MDSTPETIVSSTRPVNPEIVSLLQRIRPGQRIRITQTVRIGFTQWTATVEGKYRDVRYLATGLATDRRPEDDVVVPIVRFTKDNGELSSISIDEATKIEAVDAPAGPSS
jgi:hypothetical protein